MTDMSSTPEAMLVEDLFAIYSSAGKEVTYVTHRGETRPYWPYRFRQAVERHAQDPVPWVEDLVMKPKPSRGFGYLEAAGRLDLSLEALVCDPTTEYHHLFSAAAVAAARSRLDEHGYVLGSVANPVVVDASSKDSPESPAAVTLPLALRRRDQDEIEVLLGGQVIGALSLQRITKALS
jgi:hypothetical protein